MIDTDAVVIGAGPVGLFQVFQLGLLGLKAEVIDALPEPGGQCVALYPDKPIYDVPGVPVCTGRELARQLMAQARPFLPTDAETGLPRHLHLKQLVSSLQVNLDGVIEVGTQAGLMFRCRAVFVAAGAGAFVPRALNLPALQGARNLHYHLTADLSDAAETHAAGSVPWSGQHLVIAGGGDEALSAVLALDAPSHSAHRPAQLTLLHRRDQFQAEPAFERQVRDLIAQGRVQLAIGQPIGATVEEGRIRNLQLLGPDGVNRELSLDHLLVRQGLSPKLGPLTDWGLALDRKQVVVSPDTFETSTAGIYAVGDINTYPNKKRLLLCGFHEATLAAHAALAASNPKVPQPLLYTTTSTLLHQRLGLAP